MTNIDRKKKVLGLAVIVLAAGQGTRMCSKQTKVLHSVAGQAMVIYAVDLALRIAGNHVVVVVGHQAGLVSQVVAQATVVRRHAGSVTTVRQRKQLGTGHAVLQSQPVFRKSKRGVPTEYLILNGDTPLLREATVRALIRVHKTARATVTLLTSVLKDASGYGRVVRTQPPSQGVSRIVEERDAQVKERAINEINVGTYVVDGKFLFSALAQLDSHNAQGEYYLPDIIALAVAQGHRVAAMVLDNPEEGLGVNTRRQLAEAEKLVRQQIRARWLDAGVTMIDPASTWIDVGVRIGKDTTLSPNVILEGETAIGEDCVLRSNVRLTNCRVGHRVEILDHCLFTNSRIEDSARVGPFVHLRAGVVVRKKAQVGNFVEMKHTELGEGSKANHLSYLGDAKIGKGVNLGAGTVTCNYDGIKKFQTVIQDGVFLGSATQLIAPVTVGARAIVAAGTTVTQNVPADALAISRVPQVTRPGWAARRRRVVVQMLPISVVRRRQSKQLVKTQLKKGR